MYVKKILDEIITPTARGTLYIFDKFFEVKICDLKNGGMLDSDLAMLYGYEVRSLNQQVKRNGGRFPSDFMFQLTKEECENLKSQNVISSWGGNRKSPYAFTEQGVYMLATVLKGEVAEQQSIFGLWK